MKALLLHDEARDEWLGRGISLGLHVLIFALLSGYGFKVDKGRTVLLTVETISGLTPLGSGTGAQGVAHNLSNQPPNLNPLAGALNLKMNETSAPVNAKPVKAPASKPAQAPNAQNAANPERVRIGINPRAGRDGGEISEGGMGNMQQAGTEDGIPGLSAAFGGRGFGIIDFNFPGNLPEESEAELWITVNPAGEVVAVGLHKATGYMALDQHVLARARELRFARLAPGVAQENQTGRVPFSFKFSGEILLR